MSHPTLEPRLDVAPVFAQPGIGWIELCERGVHRRVMSGRNADHLAYLRGWCAAIAGDVDGALGALMRLTTSPVPGLSSAVRTDIATIIASSDSAERAMHWIQTYEIRDLGVMDLVAATYVELDRPDDAAELTRMTLDTSTQASAEVTCRRLTRRIVLASPDERRLPIEKLASLGARPKGADPVCARLHNAIQCWDDPGDRCIIHLQDENIDPRNMFLLRAYHHWPRQPASYVEWTSFAKEAALALPLPGADAMMLAAYDAAFTATRGECVPSLRDALGSTADRVASRKLPVPPRFGELLARCGVTARLPAPLTAPPAAP